MKSFVFLLIPVFLFCRIQVGGVNLESSLNLTFCKKSLLSSVYKGDDHVLLVFRKLEEKNEENILLKKLEQNFPSLTFHQIKMNSGRILKAGIFTDPFLYDWIFITRLVRQFQKKILVVIAFRESKAAFDYFSFLDHLRILSV